MRSGKAQTVNFQGRGTSSHYLEPTDNSAATGDRLALRFSLGKNEGTRFFNRGGNHLKRPTLGHIGGKEGVQKKSGAKMGPGGV